MTRKSRGEREAEFTEAIIKVEKEYLGRGPADARTFFVDDMIIVRLRGVLTLAEIRLAEKPEGLRLVKETRRQLFETILNVLETITRDVTGCNVISLHSDISTKTGERIIVLTVDCVFD